MFFPARALTAIVILLPASLFADLITLKSGAQISGAIESGTSRELRIRASGRLEVIPVERIQSIRFSEKSLPATRSAPATPQPDAPATPQPDAPPMLPAHPILPAGTEIVIRTIDRIETKKADPKREYLASLDQPLAIEGAMAAPVNSTALLRVTEIKNAKVKGKSSLTLQVIALMVNGRRITLQTEDASSESGSQGKRTAMGAGAGAGAGAVIGAAAGGAGGAAAGAAAGAAGAILFGQTVKIEPETRFTFKLAREASFE